MFNYLVNYGLELFLVIPAIILFNIGTVFILFIMFKFFKGEI